MPYISLMKPIVTEFLLFLLCTELNWILLVIVWVLFSVFISFLITPLAAARRDSSSHVSVRDKKRRDEPKAIVIK